MYWEPIILPLDIDGTIFALQDVNGRIIGAGSRDACELLVHVLNHSVKIPISESPGNCDPPNHLRAAIVV